MTPQKKPWYIEWAIRHCAAFGFREADVETVLAWKPVFERLYTPGELADATLALIARIDAPQYADKHRGAIMAVIKATRERARMAPAPAPSDDDFPSGCLVCKDEMGRPMPGVGLVWVPHPGLDETGRWYARLRPLCEDPAGLKRWVPVACVCPEGLRRSSLATLPHYEKLYPNWSEVAADRRAVLTADVTSRPSADEVRQAQVSVRELVRQTANRLTLPEKETA